MELAAEFIRFGAMDGTKPYEFIRFGAMDATTPYEFIGFRGQPTWRAAMGFEPTLAEAAGGQVGRSKFESCTFSQSKRKGATFKPKRLLRF